MMTPKAVVFDLGKVLLDFDFGIALRKFLPRVTVPLTDLVRLIDQSPLLHQYERGLLTSEEFFVQVRVLSGFRGTLEEFSRIFGDIFTEIGPMVALHTQLRQRGLPTYVFSNTNELAIRHVRQRFAFFSQFDGYVLSYEQHLMKPEAGFYEALERMSGLRGGELFYFDDCPQYVAAGWARGWQGAVHETPEQSRAALVRASLL
jgi:putative hydrolase of the HAD superfamily